jgi:hypothetical protein
MVRPGAPDGYSWTMAVLLHLDLIMFAALLIDGEVEVPIDPDPPIYDAVAYSATLRRRPPIPFERVSDWTGRWPMHCDHAALLRMFRKWPDEVVAETRCRECGWPWWVLRAGVAWD